MILCFNNRRSILLAIGIAFIFIFSAPFIHAQSIDVLLIQIQEMQKQVLELQNQLIQLQVQPTVFVFNNDLKTGAQNEDVKKLQEVLTSEGIYAGPITGYFGPLTKAAVIKFQEKYADEILKPLNLTKGTGFFGLSTRKKLNKIFAVPAPEIKIDFTDGKTKEITVAQGSPVTLVWNIRGINLADPTPCEAAVDEVAIDGTMTALTDYYYSWIGPQPASGSQEVLAYSTGQARIFKLTCSTTTGIKTSSVSVKVIEGESEDKMIITMLANGISGASVAKTSVTGLEKVDLSWTTVGDAYPTVCTLSDIGNKIIAKNLLSLGSYSIQNPQIGQRYYINCIDGDGEYAFDGVELIE
ncbi:peptidoglycan-binding protein [Patescibacteria group bacterium]|nr:peptidoglycan-binding protein [Patescibacteria group bacterium]